VLHLSVLIETMRREGHHGPSFQGVSMRMRKIILDHDQRKKANKS
jgi:predicted membrane GTPase involved in stress response